MISDAKLNTKPWVFRTLTDLSLREFEKLLPAFDKSWNDYIWEHHIQGKERKRRYGGGRSPHLKSLEDNEHDIGGVKRSKIVHDIFRNRKAGYVDLVMETSCGLHNFRVDERRLTA